MEKIGVVHLVRACNGLEPFQRFLNSYLRYSNAAAHDLLLVYKGFNDPDHLAQFRSQVKRLPTRALCISDYGYDLRAYYLAAKNWNYTFLSFFNSFSEILADRWLDIMLNQASKEQIGLVGATGSFESPFSMLISDHSRPAFSLSERILTFLRSQIARIYFRPFPNPHIRTNAFMISRDLMLKTWPKCIFSKRMAYAFESGRYGLTQRIVCAGFKALVVGIDGLPYEQQDWPISRTFRQGDQENLLVADNQTRQYALASTQERKRLSARAWGERAEPTAEISKSI